MNAKPALHSVTTPGLQQQGPHAALAAARPSRRESDFRIIGEHLRKARQSNSLATRLHAQGLTVDAEQQNRLTHVFLQNALYRIKPAPGPHD